MRNPFFFFVTITFMLGFSLGIYFRYSQESPTRDIASVQPRGLAKADDKVTSAMKDCLAESVGDQGLALKKTDVDGQKWSIVSLECTGDKAKTLYEAVIPYSDEQYVKFSDGRRGVGRFFGRAYPPSQCVRVTRGARGKELNIYNCAMHLDINNDLIQAMKF